MNALRLSLLLIASLAAACGPAELAVDASDDLTTADSSNLAAASSGRFELFTSKDGQTYFQLLAGNGEKVLASEGYASVGAAQEGIASVRANGTNPQRFLMREASDGAHYFVVVAANGAIIGTSEMYVSSGNAQRGAATVQRVVANATAQGEASPGQTRFETFKNLEGRYTFHLKANNGQIVLQSQSYASLGGANNGIASVKVNGTIASHYELRSAADGKTYFVLKAANGAVIGNSETYASRANAERGIAAVQALLVEAH